jgi:biotin operon repressor
MGARVDNREFVITWTRSETLDDVTKTLGMTKPGVQGRAKVLRKAGVNLKKFARKGRALTQLDVAQLNSLIKKTEKG